LATAVVDKKRGRFITLEGGEGVGKSTQMAAADAALQAAGLATFLTREPGGTERAERIRELLLRPTAETMPVSCELLLMFAARATHLENSILPALERGIWVICDRFTDATYAYQGAGRGVPRQEIELLERLVQRGLKPDLTLLLDAPVEVALARAKRRNADQGGDRFERERESFFERVRQGYLDIACAEPQRVKIIDAAGEAEQVGHQVRAAVGDFLSGVHE
jgi:dTMP kinase